MPLPATPRCEAWRSGGPVRWPLGFDGRFAVGGRLPYGPSAARGTWSAEGGSLVLVTHVFGDRTVELSIESADGFRAKVQGRAED